MHIYTPHGIMEFLYPIHKQLDFHSIPMISGSRSGLSHSRLARPVTPWGIPSAATRPWWFCPKVQRRPALGWWDGHGGFEPCFFDRCDLLLSKD